MFKSTGFVVCLFFLFTQPVFSSDKMKKENFIISPGGVLIEYVLENGSIKGSGSLPESKQWSDSYWPSYDRKNGLIYFEAEHKGSGWSRQIFFIAIDDKKMNPIRVVEGRQPSISLDGSMLAYSRHPNQLWLFDIKSKESKKAASDILAAQPVVWISSKDLLYSDLNNNLVRYDIGAGKADKTGHDHVIPGALSPGENRVLCGSYDGSKILMYTINTNKIEVLKKSILFSMGSSFVWSRNGKYFLYTKQTLSNLIRLNESRSLYRYAFGGEETLLIDKFSLFGGFSK